MFTAITAAFKFFGINISADLIRLGLILLAVLTFLGIGYAGYSAVEDWLGDRAYQAEAAHTNAVDQQQIKIITKEDATNNKAVATQTTKLLTVQKNFAKINSDIAAQTNTQNAGPITQKAIEDLRGIYNAQ